VITRESNGPSPPPPFRLSFAPELLIEAELSVPGDDVAATKPSTNARTAEDTATCVVAVLPVSAWTAVETPPEERNLREAAGSSRENAPSEIMEFREDFSKGPCRTHDEACLLQVVLTIPPDGSVLVFLARYEELSAIRTDDAAQVDMMLMLRSTGLPVQCKEWGISRSNE
jgi:hypothetical protein